MPIDPRIPLLGQPPARQTSPLELVSQVLQVQAQRSQAEERAAAAQEARAKRAREAQFAQALQGAIVPGPDGTPTIDWPRLYPHLEPEQLINVQSHLEQTAVRQAQLQNTNLDIEKKKRAYMADMLGAVEKANYDPNVYGTILVGAQKAGALTRAEMDAKLDEAARDETAIQRHVTTALASVPAEAEAGFTLGPGQTRHGPSGQVIATGPAREAPQRALQAKDVLLDGRPALASFDPGTGTYHIGGQDVTARVRPIPPQGPGPEPIVPIIGPDGKPVYVTRSQALGQSPVGGAPGAGRPATEGERKAAGFHAQMKQALTTINQLEAQLTEKDLYQIQSLPQEGITGAINRGLMSDAAKRYIQAFNQFTEARLRPVSGAAIANSEYERDRATYGKQYAETPDLAEQRQAAREQALGSLQIMGGTAVEETGEEAGGRPSGHQTTPYRVGDIVTVKGRKVRVTKLLPNGKYEAVPVP